MRRADRAVVVDRRPGRDGALRRRPARRQPEAADAAPRARHRRGGRDRGRRRALDGRRRACRRRRADASSSASTRCSGPETRVRRRQASVSCGRGSRAEARPRHRRSRASSREGRVLIADGATGTNYQTMGMEPGLAPEEWLFQAPERVVELHRAFVDAGADIVLTCTFGATPLRLEEGPLAGRAREVNVRAAELARDGAGPDRLVAGSLGPTGQLIEPYGLLDREQRRSRPTPSRRARSRRAAPTCSCWRRSSRSRRPSGRSRGSRAPPTCRSSSRSRSTWGRGR